jgi:NADPH:quinone reductase-like Zn-dependent oxidoreductase
LSIGEADKPTPTEDQVLVRVVASSVNSGDWRVVLADPFLVRLMGGMRKPKDPSLGGDAAGVVEAVGSGVTHVKPGDEVFGMRTGAFADYVAGQNFVAKPANLTFEQSAAVPIAALTALQGLRDHGHLVAGQQVLINGAGGGVGHFAVQIARALGADVTAATRTDKLDLVREAGADHVIDYTREDFTTGGRRFDLVVDMGSPASVSRLRSVLLPTGTFVQIGAAKGRGGVIGRIVSAKLRQRLLKQRVTFFVAKPNLADMNTLRDLVEAGKVRPVIDRTYPLSEIAEAIAYAATERTRGKIVIKVADQPVAG